MAGIEFTPEEYRALEEVARIDEWSLCSLEGQVRHKMWDGMSFKTALMRVLAEAPRPDDKPDPAEKLPKAAREDMIRRLEEIRRQQIEAFQKSPRLTTIK